MSNIQDNVFGDTKGDLYYIFGFFLSITCGILVMSWVYICTNFGLSLFYICFFTHFVFARIYSLIYGEVIIFTTIIGLLLIGMPFLYTNSKDKLIKSIVSYAWIILCLISLPSGLFGLIGLRYIKKAEKRKELFQVED